MTDDEAAMARLVRLAGTRAEVPRDAEARVRRVVLDEVRRVAARRRQRRRLVIGGLALPVAAALVLAVRLSRPAVAPAGPPQTVATVERVEGAVSLAVGAPARANDVISTAGGRVGLRLVTGASVRVDRETRVRLVSEHVLELVAGAVYVDSGAASPEIEIRTTLGVVTDVGTQFEVRLDAEALRVRVRSGAVEVHRDDAVTMARPGTEVRATTTAVSTQPVAPYGPDWEWTVGVGTGFDIEGQSLDAFLSRLARELGWHVTYDDAQLEREASGMILHGSTMGVTPTEALEVALATTGLTHRLERGELHVARAARP